MQIHFNEESKKQFTVSLVEKQRAKKYLTVKVIGLAITVENLF